MEASYLTEALTVLEQCGSQEKLIAFVQGLTNPDDQKNICEQIIRLNQVTPKGMVDYCARARTLLESSRQGVNPFDNYKPEVPTGVFLKPGTEEFDQYEASGLEELAKTGFVLIAGGLGERLGYSGIKVDLPVCTIADDYSYLKYYANYVHACRDRALQFVPEDQRDSFYFPLCIMVSNDTESRTLALLEKNDYFGLGKDRVDIIKQENVPALMNNDAEIAFDEQKVSLVTKPHGHGDIHNLLFDSGVAKKWLEMGKEWMVFIQDTNALAMKAIPSILGVSRKNNWQMNSVCVPRVPGESMGAIVRLVNETDATKELVINVEYNQLDSLLKSKGNGADVKNEQGYSHFPGNTNTLVFKLPEYYAKLSETGGVIPEFVNPKYANEERTEFKSATRLECMMQDYPKLLSSTGEVGFTTYETWYCFSPAKNNVKDAAACVAKGIPSYGAAEAEYNFYEWTNKMLVLAGVDVQRATEKSDFNGMQFAFGPKVLLDPRCALTFSEIKQRFSGACKITAGASLILNDKDVQFDNLELNDATLVCEAGCKTPSQPLVFVAATSEDPEVF